MAILINFFDNVILQAISEEIVPKVSFFKDRYFPTGAGDIFKANEVLTEYRSGDRKLAAFVDQKAGDIPIGRRSYEVHSYKPAYIAPSRLLTLDELTKRGFGEALYPGMDEAQRAARLLADDMNDMENRIARREEWMAAETMIGNGCVMQEYIDGATKGDSTAPAIIPIPLPRSGTRTVVTSGATLRPCAVCCLLVVCLQKT